MIKKRIWASILFGDTILNVLFILIISSAVLCGAKYYLDMSKTERANADISAISTAIEQYELEHKKIEREISDLWEVGKRSKTKEKRLAEIEFIIDGIIADKEIKKLRQEIRDLTNRLKKEGIKINEEN